MSEERISPKKKILFSDMDGTLLSRDKKISAAQKDLLSKMVQAGGRLVLSSGRTLGSILRVAEENDLLFPDTLIIAVNGNIVYDYDNQRFLLNKTVPMDIMEGVIDLAHKHGLYIQSYDDQYVVCERSCPELEQYAKATGMQGRIVEDITSAVGKPACKLLAIDLKDRSKLDLLQKEVTERYGHTVTALYSCREYLEIFDKTAGKGSAVQFVCDYLGVPVSETVAAGDAENDISMLDAAGVAVAMANAHPEVKKHADFVTTKDNDHDGLSEAILKYFGV